MAIPDPLHSVIREPGDTFSVAGAQVTYIGVFATGGKLEVRLRLAGEIPPETVVATPDGQTVTLSGTSGSIASQPFGSAAQPPAMDETLTLIVGEMLVPLRVGEVR